MGASGLVRLTVNSKAGMGVQRLTWIMANRRGRCPSLAPAKNSLKDGQPWRLESWENSQLVFSWKTAQEIMDVPGQQQAAGVVGKGKQAEMQEMHSENGVGQEMVEAPADLEPQF